MLNFPEPKLRPGVRKRVIPVAPTSEKTSLRSIISMWTQAGSKMEKT